MRKVKINESDIRKMVENAVRTIMNEGWEDDSYIFNKEEYLKELQKHVPAVMSDINNFLSQFNLKAKLWESPFERYVGIYKNGSVKTGTMRIGININAIANFVERERETELYDGATEKEGFVQVNITLWHEVGHALVNHLRLLRWKDTNKQMGRFDKNFRNKLSAICNDEEGLAEEFGEEMAGVGYGASDLLDFLEENKELVRY